MVDLQAATEPRSVPEHIVRPPYVASGRGPTHSLLQIQNAESLVRLGRASRVTAEVLATTGSAVPEDSPEILTLTSDGRSPAGTLADVSRFSAVL